MFCALRRPGPPLDAFVDRPWYYDGLAGYLRLRGEYLGYVSMRKLDRASEPFHGGARGHFFQYAADRWRHADARDRTRS